MTQVDKLKGMALIMDLQDMICPTYDNYYARSSKPLINDGLSKLNFITINVDLIICYGFKPNEPWLPYNVQAQNECVLFKFFLYLSNITHKINWFILRVHWRLDYIEFFFHDAKLVCKYPVMRTSSYVDLLEVFSSPVLPPFHYMRHYTERLPRRLLIHNACYQPVTSSDRTRALCSTEWKIFVRAETLHQPPPPLGKVKIVKIWMFWEI